MIKYFDFSLKSLIRFFLRCTRIVYVLLCILGFTTISAQSIQDLQKLKAEFERSQKGLRIPSSIAPAVDPPTGLPRRAEITPYEMFEIEKEEGLDGSRYFGYDFFTHRDTVTFWDNLPTPANYLLGPGDELVISLWGETQLRKTYIISRDGKIYDEKVGLINMTGKSIVEARQFLKTQFGRIYSTLNGDVPSTYIDVSLGELRSINVNFVGEVKFPGIYPIHPFSTVITGLIQAGGVDTTGSLRKIEVKRNGESFITIDLYDYLLKGNLPKNIQLRDQDIVIIPVRMGSVEVDSAVVKPGIYESISGESIYDLIQYAGGLKADAADKIALSRIKPLTDREDKNINEGYYIKIEEAKLTLAQDGDRVLVHHVFKENNLVEIIGQVKVPGLYHYYKGMTLKELLSLGGGFEDSTFWNSVYHNQAEIIRRDPNSRYENIIKVNLGDIYNGNGLRDVKLQNLDRVVIHANLNYFEKDNVYISGEVNIPGAYPLTSDNETLKSVIGRAGDFTSKALKNGISIYRDKKYFEVSPNNSTIEFDDVDEVETKDVKEDQNIVMDKVRVAWKNDSVILMPGDSIVVKESPGTVNISGQVYNPGLIEFREGKKMRYYINGAGGITDRGNKNSIIVVYANGVVSPARWYSTPKIDDGATIIVNEKPFSEPFDPTEFASTMASFLSSIVTIMVLSQQL